MAPKNPIGRLADTAISTLKNPLDTAGKVVEQAKGTAALGRMVAEQVGKSAVSKAADTAGVVVGRATGRTTGRSEPSAPRDGGPDTTLRPVPDVNEPGHTPAENKGSAQEPSTRSAAKASSTKKAGARKSPTKKVSATPADVAEIVESAVAEDPKKTAATKATTPAKKTAAKKVTATKAPAKKSAAKQSSPGDKLPKKSTGKGRAPRSAEQVKNLEGTDLLDTPAGTPAAGPASNPDTTEKELHQPGTEGIVEPSTAKKVASETAKLRKAAETNPE